ncbi:MAG TPA: glycosyltransferase family 2 protein [Roseiflexaceae bacterium]|nr:glycosyltransferase family 2 protein [Roseiflexaceae bacterium]
MFVSLIIINYNGADLLLRCCEALGRTEYEPYELIVVDNASADGSLEYLARAQPGARVIANSENVGFGRACNQGAAAARGDLLLFLNPDVVATPGWLAALVANLADNPDAAITCPSTLYPDQQPPNAPEPVEEQAAVPGAALAIRRAAWEQIGGFDEQMFLYWEDVELCWRAWLLGWRVLADLRAVVYHDRGGSAGGRRWDAEQTKNGLYTHLKLMRWRRVLPFAALLLLKTAAKLALWRDPAILGAWAWNLRHLGHTLAQRRALLARRRIDPADLERRIDAHTRRQKRERRERRRLK